MVGIYLKKKAGPASAGRPDVLSQIYLPAELKGQGIAGKILVFPKGKGSTVGSYALYRLKKNGKAPLAIINKECETIVAVGAIISEIPCIDKIDIGKIKDGSTIEADAEKGVVKVD